MENLIQQKEQEKAKNRKEKGWLTELVFILDRSGSMGGLEEDTVGGFNTMIEKQKKEEGACYVSTVLVNSESDVLHDRVPLSDIPKMTREDYIPYGSTALIDAIGSSIEHIYTIHKYARPEDVPAHTMFVITTDGEENSSKKFTIEQVKKMIEEKKEKSGWEFLFIGANIDAVETAASYGISKNRAVNYHADRHGSRLVYDTIADTACYMRSCGGVSSDWNEKLSEDYKHRKKRK